MTTFQPVMAAGSLKTLNQNMSLIAGALNGIRVLSGEVDTQATYYSESQEEDVAYGSVGEHPLGVSFPEGAICLGRFIRVTTGLTGSGAVPDLGVMQGSTFRTLFDNDAPALAKWTDYQSFPLSYSSEEGAVNPYLRPVAPSVSGYELTFKNSTASLTAGKFMYYLFYIIPAIVSTDPEQFLA